MNDIKKVNWDISPDDVGCNEYSYYVVTEINFHLETKTIWSISYSYIWDCGDGCCSDTEHDMAYSGQIAKWLKDRILKEMPGYKFES